MKSISSSGMSNWRPADQMQHAQAIPTPALQVGRMSRNGTTRQRDVATLTPVI